MTLIAAFRIQDIPVVIGDMRTTAGEQRGARKKVHLVNDKLAIGWAGSALAGSRVVKRLFEEFGNRETKIDELAKVLTTFQHYTDDDRIVHIVGWLLDGEPVCFRWNSGYPKEVFENHSHFEGTGEKYFLNLIQQDIPNGHGPGIETKEEVATFFALAKFTQMINHEVWTDQMYREMFGYCYEVLYLDGDRFKYIPNYTFLMWAAERDGNGHHFQMGPLMVKYDNLGDYSVVQTTHLWKPGGHETCCDFVTPVHDAMRSLNPMALGRRDMSSDYYCNILQYKFSEEKNATVTFVSSSSDHEIMSHTKTPDGKDCFRLDLEKVRQIIGVS